MKYDVDRKQYGAAAIADEIDPGQGMLEKNFASVEYIHDPDAVSYVRSHDLDNLHLNNRQFEAVKEDRT